jgi:hypothetical protein
MLKITHDRHRRLIEEFSLDWTDKANPNCGAGFPCDRNGNIDEASLAPAGRDNLAYHRAHPELFDGPFLRDWSRYVAEPARGICPHCGTEVVLDGDVSCDGCGQWYNTFGQELVPPSMWGEDTGERFDNAGNCIYSPYDEE